MQLHQTQLLKTNNQQSTGKDKRQQPNTNNEGEDEQSDTDSDGKDEQMKTDNNEVDEQQNTDKDKEEDIVPVVIRPGHIRFEPLGKGMYGSYLWIDNYLWHLSSAIFFMISYLNYG